MLFLFGSTCFGLDEVWSEGRVDIREPIKVSAIPRSSQSGLRARLKCVGDSQSLASLSFASVEARNMSSESSGLKHQLPHPPKP